MHLALISAPDATTAGKPRLRHLRLDEADCAGRLPATRIDLMIVDARAMSFEEVQEALQIVDGFNTRGIFRRAILLAAVPSQPLVIAAMRAGIGDLYFGALTARAVLRNLRVAWPRSRLVRDRLAPLIAVWSLLAPREATRSGARAAIPEREIQVTLREDALEADTQRLADLRQELDKRHADLLARERLSLATAERIQAESLRLAEARDRLEEATQQTQGASCALAPDALRRREEALFARQQELDRRERALASREALLREYEAMLAGHANVPAGA